MAKAPTNSAAQRVRKKVRKNVADGIAHVHASFNNTIITITDRQGNTHGLEQSQAQSAITRVLRNLAAPGFALFLELLKHGHDIAQQLHDDRGRDVGHDAQREYGKP